MSRKSLFAFLPVLLCVAVSYGQGSSDKIDSFSLQGDVRVAVDRALPEQASKPLVIILYALPNGSTIAQTMGEKLAPGDDWHFDIQHIRAQTKFIRQQWRQKNVVVVYLGNAYRSWPAWKAKHADYVDRVRQIMDTLLQHFPAKDKVVYLNGHSGGGRFIFSYLDGVTVIPSFIKRISFLDSDYGYDSTYYGKLRDWLVHNRGAYLNVFAYNDSVALYQGKPFVSATGGTWYRTHRMIADMSRDFSLRRRETDSLIIYKGLKGRLQFFLKPNPKREIYHTRQVELNGFIHSIFCGTPRDSKKYIYYSKRAYANLIE